MRSLLHLALIILVPFLGAARVHGVMHESAFDRQGLKQFTCPPSEFLGDSREAKEWVSAAPTPPQIQVP